MLEVNINKEKTLQINNTKDGLLINNELFEWDLIQTNPNRYHVIKDYKSYDLDVIEIDKETKILKVKLNNQEFEIEVKDRMDILLQKLGMNNISSQKIKDLKAPMPGKIIEISVSTGDEVKKGDKLGIIEAMKMENIIKAPADTVIKDIKVKAEDQVEKNHVLFLFD